MKKVFTILIIVSISIAANLNLDLKAGWNMTSVPYDSVFSTSIPSDIIYGDIFTREFVSDEWRYEPVDTLDPSKAYWVLSLCDTTITVSGDSVYCIEYSTLFPGWNMVGVPASPVDIDSFVDFFGSVDIINPQWGYNTDTRGYDEAPVTIPTKGLWLLTADTIVVDTCLLNYPQPGSPLWTVEIDSAAQYYRNISSPSLDEYQNRSLSEVEMSGRQQALIAVNL